MSTLKVVVLLLLGYRYMCQLNVIPDNMKLEGNTQEKDVYVNEHWASLILYCYIENTSENRGSLIDHIIAYSFQQYPHINMLHTLDDIIAYNDFVYRVRLTYNNIFAFATIGPSQNNNVKDGELFLFCEVYEHHITMERIKILCYKLEAEVLPEELTDMFKKIHDRISCLHFDPDVTLSDYNFRMWKETECNQLTDEDIVEAIGPQAFRFEKSRVTTPDDKGLTPPDTDATSVSTNTEDNTLTPEPNVMMMCIQSYGSLLQMPATIVLHSFSKPGESRR